MLLEQDPASHSYVTDWLAQLQPEAGVPETIGYNEESMAGDIRPRRTDSRHHHKSRGRRQNRSPDRHNSRHELQQHQLEQPDGQGLATRPGLYPVFQATEREASNKEQLDVNAHAKHKRKRTSSVDSYLAPAVIGKGYVLQQQVRRASHERSSSIAPSGHGERVLDTTSTTLKLCSQSTPSPEKPAKTYERRPRHRTKEDRYELKQEKKAKESRAKAKKSVKPNSKRKEKSGAINIQSYKAKNVAPDRLTLRPAAKLGLFNRGRASAPVLRRGLPDLSFSEMTFLSAPKADQTNLAESQENKRKRKKDKGADLDEEMSRFFNATRLALSERDSNLPNLAQERERPQDLRSRRLQSPQIRKPILPSKEQRVLQAPDLKDHRYEPPRLVQEAVNPSDLRHPQEVLSHSTTYFTWSQSPGVEHVSICQNSPDNNPDQVPGPQIGHQTRFSNYRASVAKLHESIEHSVKAGHLLEQPRPSDHETVNTRSRFSSESIKVKDKVEGYLNGLRSRTGSLHPREASHHLNAAYNWPLSMDKGDLNSTSAVLDMLVDKFESKFQQLAAKTQDVSDLDTRCIARPQIQAESRDDVYDRNQAMRSTLPLHTVGIESPRRTIEHHIRPRYQRQIDSLETPSRGIKHPTLTDPRLPNGQDSPSSIASGWKGPGLVYGQQFQLQAPSEAAKRTYATDDVRNLRNMEEDPRFPSAMPAQSSLRFPNAETPQAIANTDVIEDNSGYFGNIQLNADLPMEDVELDYSNDQPFSEKLMNQNSNVSYVKDFALPSPPPTFNSTSRRRTSEIDRLTIGSRQKLRTATTTNHAEAKGRFGMSMDSHGEEDVGPKHFWKPNMLY